jgi:ABC-2 type transport system permease protein
MILAWTIDFCFAALIGLAAFVVEEVAAFNWIYQKLLFILGGMLIPLDFFPGWLRSISQASPFAYTIYGPARLFVDPSLERFMSLLIGQLLWVAFLGITVTALYRRGMRWLAINGG